MMENTKQVLFHNIKVNDDFNKISKYSATCMKYNNIQGKLQARYVEIAVNVNIVANVK